MRESAIFGILGVKTLGYYVDASISELRFDRTLVLILSNDPADDRHRLAVADRACITEDLHLADTAFRRADRNQGAI